ncbi:MAG: proton-conducting transporter membrane subunit [Candidatus Stygibacter frigidus]|nr:proton-conducting transporter membrane subunit [Candidatus Stygibacter frigidus]
MNAWIPLYVVIPLASAFIMAILGRLVKNMGKVILLIELLFLTCLTLVFILNSKGTLSYNVGGFPDVGDIPIAIYMVMDGLTKLLLLIISAVGFITALFSISYTREYTAERKFYILFSLMIAGMNGMVISGDIFNIYVFLEIAAISSYILVAFGVEKHQLEASFKYQVLGCLASLLILLAIGFIYWGTGTLNIADISRQLPYSANFIKFVSLLFLVGFGLKAAIFPFHSWLPDAHSSAPSPISAMLSGVLIKAIGLYVIFRLFFNMFALNADIAMTILVLGTLSMIIGGLMAIGQWDMKRLLAYSSISQMGYVVMAVGIGMTIMVKDGSKTIAAFAFLGALLHLLNHSVFKSLLFLNAGAVEYSTGIRDMRKLGGLAEKMPITSKTSLIASLSISGIPPFNGFFSKLIIILAAVRAHYYWLAFLAVAVSVVTISYFMKFQKYIFYNKPGEYDNQIKEVPAPMSIAMVILALLCLMLSLMVIPSIRDQFIFPAVNVLIKNLQYSTAVLG